MNPFYQPKKRDPHTHQTRDISLPRDRWEPSAIPRYVNTLELSGSMITSPITLPGPHTDARTTAAIKKFQEDHRSSCAASHDKRGSPQSAYKGSLQGGGTQADRGRQAR